MKIQSALGSTLFFTRVRKYVYCQNGGLESLRHQVIEVRNDGIIVMRHPTQKVLFKVILADHLDALKVRSLLDKTKNKNLIKKEAAL